VPGLGRSERFKVGREATGEAAYHAFRVFFHQRCGQELGAPYTETVKHACHVEVYESGYLVGNPGYTPKPGEEFRSFKGGYHDAADFDHFTYHLPATSNFLAVYEVFPDAFADGQFDLPESGNGIPDLLDEAHWGLMFWLENQLESGAVPLGRGNDCDAWTQNTGGRRMPWGILPPTARSSPTYAAVAAQFSVQLRTFDEQLADRYLESAKRAFAYANKRSGEPFPKNAENKGQPSLGHIHWAAAELYRATGEAEYRAVVEDLSAARNGRIPIWADDYDLAAWAILRSEHPYGRFFLGRERRAFLRRAGEIRDRTEASAYRLGTGHYTRAAAWGEATPGRFGATLVRAHAITGDQGYLDAAALNYDFLLGVNPMGKSFMTGVGWSAPFRPEVTRIHYRDWIRRHPHDADLKSAHGGGPQDLSGDITPGITVYGLGPKLWYYKQWPLMHAHRDIWGEGAEVWNEFTMHQTIGKTAIMCLYLAAVDNL